MSDTPWDDVVIAMGAACLVIAAVGWQRHLLHREHAPATTESWQQVRERFPIPAPLSPPNEASAEVLATVLRANPFSPARRQAPQVTTASSTGSTTPAKPAAAQFIYKGRVLLGTTQRAIVEDVSTKKTYFLQVGQDVAGLKVLDISETQVVLSDPQTSKETVVSIISKPLATPQRDAGRGAGKP